VNNLTKHAAIALALIVTTSLSHSQTTYQTIAWCQQVATSYSKELYVPMEAGAVDSRRMPSYHPCKFAYFESECRQAAYAQSMRECVNQMETYHRRPK